MSCIDRAGNPTDDADRMPYGCDEFAPGDEYDPMYSDDAPSHDDKPYGWGIETFEDPALVEANRAMWSRMAQRCQNVYTSAGNYLETWGMYAGRPKSVYPTADDIEYRNMLLRAWTKRCPKLQRCSDRVWAALCDRCETHAEAVAKYSKWAAKVAKK